MLWHGPNSKLTKIWSLNLKLKKLKDISSQLFQLLKSISLCISNKTKQNQKLRKRSHLLISSLDNSNNNNNNNNSNNSNKLDNNLKRNDFFLIVLFKFHLYTDNCYYFIITISIFFFFSKSFIIFKYIENDNYI